MAGLNGLLAVLGLKLAPIQAIFVVATNCKEASKMLYWSMFYEMILEVGMPRECQAISDLHFSRSWAESKLATKSLSRTNPRK